MIPWYVDDGEEQGDDPSVLLDPIVTGGPPQGGPPLAPQPIQEEAPTVGIPLSALTAGSYAGENEIDLLQPAPTIPTPQGPNSEIAGAPPPTIPGPIEPAPEPSILQRVGNFFDAGSTGLIDEFAQNPLQSGQPIPPQSNQPEFIPPQPNVVQSAPQPFATPRPPNAQPEAFDPLIETSVIPAIDPINAVSDAIAGAVESNSIGEQGFGEYPSPQILSPDQLPIGTEEGAVIHPSDFQTQFPTIEFAPAPAGRNPNGYTPLLADLTPKTIGEKFVEGNQKALYLANQIAAGEAELPSGSTIFNFLLGKEFTNRNLRNQIVPTLTRAEAEDVFGTRFESVDDSGVRGTGPGDDLSYVWWRWWADSNERAKDNEGVGQAKFGLKGVGQSFEAAGEAMAKMINNGEAWVPLGAGSSGPGVRVGARYVPNFWAIAQATLPVFGTAGANVIDNAEQVPYVGEVLDSVVDSAWTDLDAVGIVMNDYVTNTRFGGGISVSELAMSTLHKDTLKKVLNNELPETFAPGLGIFAYGIDRIRSEETRVYDATKNYIEDGLGPTAREIEVGVNTASLGYTNSRDFSGRELMINKRVHEEQIEAAAAYHYNTLFELKVQGLGDSEEANFHAAQSSLYGGELRVLQSKSHADILNETEKIRDSVMAALFLSPGDLLADLTIKASRLGPVDAILRKTTNQVEKSADEFVERAARIRRRDAQQLPGVGSNYDTALERSVKSLGAAQKTSTLAYLDQERAYSTFTGILNGAQTYGDVRKIIDAYLRDPSELTEGLIGLSSDSFKAASDSMGRYFVDPSLLVLDDGAAMRQALRAVEPEVKQFLTRIGTGPVNTDMVVTQMKEFAYKGRLKLEGALRYDLPVGSQKVRYETNRYTAKGAPDPERKTDNLDRHEVVYYDGENRILERQVYETELEAKKVATEHDDLVTGNRIDLRRENWANRVSTAFRRPLTTAFIDGFPAGHVQHVIGNTITGQMRNPYMPFKQEKILEGMRHWYGDLMSSRNKDAFSETKDTAGALYHRGWNISPHIKILRERRTGNRQSLGFLDEGEEQFWLQHQWQGATHALREGVPQLVDEILDGARDMLPMNRQERRRASMYLVDAAMEGGKDGFSEAWQNVAMGQLPDSAGLIGMYSQQSGRFVGRVNNAINTFFQTGRAPSSRRVIPDASAGNNTPIVTRRPLPADSPLIETPPMSPELRESRLSRPTLEITPEQSVRDQVLDLMDQESEQLMRSSAEIPVEFGRMEHLGMDIQRDIADMEAVMRQALNKSGWGGPRIEEMITSMSDRISNTYETGINAVFDSLAGERSNFGMIIDLEVEINHATVLREHRVNNAFNTVKDMLVETSNQLAGGKITRGEFSSNRQAAWSRFNEVAQDAYDESAEEIQVLFSDYAKRIEAGESDVSDVQDVFEYADDNTRDFYGAYEQLGEDAGRWYEDPEHYASIIEAGRAITRKARSDTAVVAKAILQETRELNTTIFDVYRSAHRAADCIAMQAKGRRKNLRESRMGGTLGAKEYDYGRNRIERESIYLQERIWETAQDELNVYRHMYQNDLQISDIDTADIPSIARGVPDGVEQIADAIEDGFGGTSTPSGELLPSAVDREAKLIADRIVEVVDDLVQRGVASEEDVRNIAMASIKRELGVGIGNQLEEGVSDLYSASIQDIKRAIEAADDKARSFIYDQVDTKLAERHLLNGRDEISLAQSMWVKTKQRTQNAWRPANMTFPFAIEQAMNSLSKARRAVGRGIRNRSNLLRQQDVGVPANAPENMVALSDYYAQQINPKLQRLIEKSKRAGNQNASEVVVSFDHSRFLDDAAGLIIPYHHWHSRAMKNLLGVMVRKPGIANKLHKITEGLDRWHEGNNTPQRVSGFYMPVYTMEDGTQVFASNPLENYLPGAFFNFYNVSPYAKPDGEKSTTTEAIDTLQAGGFGTFPHWKMLNDFTYNREELIERGALTDVPLYRTIGNAAAALGLDLPYSTPEWQSWYGKRMAFGDETVGNLELSDDEMRAYAFTQLMGAMDRIQNDEQCLPEQVDSGVCALAGKYLRKGAANNFLQQMLPKFIGTRFTTVDPGERIYYGTRDVSANLGAERLQGQGADARMVGSRFGSLQGAQALEGSPELTNGFLQELGYKTAPYSFSAKGNRRAMSAVQFGREAVVDVEGQEAAARVNAKEIRQVLYDAGQAGGTNLIVTRNANGTDPEKSEFYDASLDSAIEAAKQYASVADIHAFVEANMDEFGDIDSNIGNLAKYVAGINNAMKYPSAKDSEKPDSLFVASQRRSPQEVADDAFSNIMRGAKTNEPNWPGDGATQEQIDSYMESMKEWNNGNREYIRDIAAKAVARMQHPHVPPSEADRLLADKFSGEYAVDIVREYENRFRNETVRLYFERIEIEREATKQGFDDFEARIVSSMGEEAASKAADYRAIPKSDKAARRQFIVDNPVVPETWAAGYKPELYAYSKSQFGEDIWQTSGFAPVKGNMSDDEWFTELALFKKKFGEDSYDRVVDFWNWKRETYEPAESVSTSAPKQGSAQATQLLRYGTSPLPAFDSGASLDPANSAPSIEEAFGERDNAAKFIAGLDTNGSTTSDLQEPGVGEGLDEVPLARPAFDPRVNPEQSPATPEEYTEGAELGPSRPEIARANSAVDANPPEASASTSSSEGFGEGRKTGGLTDAERKQFESEVEAINDHWKTYLALSRDEKSQYLKDNEDFLPAWLAYKAKRDSQSEDEALADLEAAWYASDKWGEYNALDQAGKAKMLREDKEFRSVWTKWKAGKEGIDEGDVFAWYNDYDNNKSGWDEYNALGSTAEKVAYLKANPAFAKIYDASVSSPGWWKNYSPSSSRSRGSSSSSRGGSSRGGGRGSGATSTRYYYNNPYGTRDQGGLRILRLNSGIPWPKWNPRR